MTRTRLAAAGAALLVTGGAGTMLVALVAAPGPWWQGYVSEAGTAGQPYAVAYRCGVLALALGVALLGWAVRPVRREPAGLLGASCLAAAAVLAGTSGLVPCSNRCPLPPYDPVTAADVVHGAASVLGMVVLTGAMLATRLTATRTATRRLAGAALAGTVPLGGAMGLTMLLAGRGALGAVLERVLLGVAVAWVVGTALLAATEAPVSPAREGGRPGRRRGPG